MPDWRQFAWAKAKLVEATFSYRIFNVVVRRKWWRNFLFTFYKHRRKQIAAVILKPVIEITSSTRYLYENFLSYESSDHANLRFFVRSFVNGVTQNLRTETGVGLRTFVNSTPGSEDQYASLYAKCCADRSNRYRDIVILILLGCRLPPSSISLDLKFVTDQTVTRAELRHHMPYFVEIAETVVEI